MRTSGLHARVRVFAVVSFTVLTFLCPLFHFSAGVSSVGISIIYPCPLYCPLSPAPFALFTFSASSFLASLDRLALQPCRTAARKHGQATSVPVQPLRIIRAQTGFALFRTPRLQHPKAPWPSQHLKHSRLISPIHPQSLPITSATSLFSRTDSCLDAAAVALPLWSVMSAIARCPAAAGAPIHCSGCVLLAPAVASCTPHQHRAWWALYLAHQALSSRSTGTPLCTIKITTALNVLSCFHHHIPLEGLTRSGDTPTTRTSSSSSSSISPLPHRQASAALSPFLSLLAHLFARRSLHSDRAEGACCDASMQ